MKPHDLWADKRLGQHFLLDMNITRRIARAAGDLRDQTVIEIGPGPGGLTRALLEAGAQVVAIERDARFLPLLEPLVAWSGDRLRIVHGDALAIDQAALAGASAQIISNLPYNIGAELLVRWLKAPAWRGPMTLMFQKEVAQRIVAKPRCMHTGALRCLRRRAARPARIHNPGARLHTGAEGRQRHCSPGRSRRRLPPS